MAESDATQTAGDTRGAVHITDVRLDGELPAGTPVGRFMIIDTVGFGGMGVVYRAYDPELDRSVALKVVHARGQVEARTRLLREARSLAKLSNPNVISIYDVLPFADDVCIAMELIDGQTLGRWVQAPGRTRAEIIEAYVAAGRGLAAAHAAGMVHRDFKPANVLMGRDGRVRVADFGLARPVEGGEQEGATSAGPPASQVTQTGAVVGTPAYTSPEQAAGQVADARSDQFSFCVALYEGLCGALPREDVPAARARAAALPAWLRGLLARGMSERPGERYPSMEALLRELKRDPALARRRAFGIGGVVVLVGLAAWAVFGRSGQAAATLCRGAQERMAEVWDPSAHDRIRSAFLATGKPYAQDTFDRASTALDRYAGAWVSMHTDACRATRVRGEQSEQLLDLRMACLDRRRGAFAALTELLAKTDAEVMNRAVLAAGALESLDGCADSAALSARIPPPGDAGTQRLVDELNRALDRVTALRDAGQFKPALELVRPLTKQADETGYALLRARAHGLAGELHSALDEPEPAESELLDGVRFASEAHDDELQSRLLARLSRCYMDEKSNAKQAYTAARVAEAAALRAGGDELLLADARFQLSRTIPEVKDGLRLAAQAFQVYERRLPGDDPRLLEPVMHMFARIDDAGNYAEARVWGERALALAIKVLGPEHPRVSEVYNNLGTTAQELGQFDEAFRFHELSLSIKEKAFGPNHPQVAFALGNMGSILTRKGELDRAAQLIERALAIRERAFGPKSAAVGSALNNLMRVRMDQGRFAEAQTLGERAVVAFSESMGPDSVKASNAYESLGELFIRQRRFREARASFERSAAARKKALGADNVEYAFALVSLINVSIAENKCAEAQGTIDEAERIINKELGPDHQDTAIVLKARAWCLLAAGRSADAIPVLEHTIGLIERGANAAGELGEPYYLLAKAFLGTGQRAKARAAAERSEAAYAKSGSGDAENLAEIRAWRRKHRLD